KKSAHGQLLFGNKWIRCWPHWLAWRPASRRGRPSQLLSLACLLACLLALAVGAVLRWGGLDCKFTASPFAIKTAPTGLAVLVTDTAPSPAWRWCSGALHPGRRPGAGCGPW